MYRQAMKALLEAGADPDADDICGSTLLMRAARLRIQPDKVHICHCTLSACITSRSSSLQYQRQRARVSEQFNAGRYARMSGASE